MSLLLMMHCLFDVSVGDGVVFVVFVLCLLVMMYCLLTVSVGVGVVFVGIVIVSVGDCTLFVRCICS